VQIDYVGRSALLNDDIRTFTEGRLERAARFLEEPVEIRVILDGSGHRKKAELHVHHRFGVLTATEESGEIRDSIHEAVEKLEKQARRSRKKFMDKRRRSDRQVAHEWPVEVVEKASVGSDRSPRVIKTSSLSIKPMSLEEAALRLENAKNDFLVFRDADHGRVNVLYKRRDGDYGLVTPEA
jgi:putative sigma-54 modulation protein